MKNAKYKELMVTVERLHGIAEIDDLYRGILYGLLFKQMEFDKDKLEFFDEKYSLEYLSLTYGKIVKQIELIMYIHEFERNMGLDRGILANALEGFLKKTDPASVRELFAALHAVKLKDQSECYELACMILDKMMQLIGKHTSEFATNSAISKITKEILAVEDGMTVYDGFCGSGRAVNEVAAGKGKVYLQDANSDTIGIAAILTILSGNEIGGIRCADSLLNPMVPKTQFDRVVCEPPFVARYVKSYMEGVPEGNCIYQESLDSETLHLRHALGRTKEDGTAVVLATMGMLFKSGRVAETRKKLVEEKKIDAIIELPGGLFPATSISTVLIVLRKNKQDDSIFMYNAKDVFEKKGRNQLELQEDRLEKMISSYRNRETIEGVSKAVSIQEIRENNYNLITTQYITTNTESEITIEDTREIVRKYGELKLELSKIDVELDGIRGRFVKGM